MSTKPTKLYKTDENSVIAGVCAGLAEYNNWDVSLVRIISVVIVLLGSGLPVIAYIVMMLVLPNKKDLIEDEYELKEDDYTIKKEDYYYD